MDPVSSSNIEQTNQTDWNKVSRNTLFIGLPVAATVAVVAALILLAPLAVPTLAFTALIVTPGLFGAAVGIALLTVALALIFKRTHHLTSGAEHAEHAEHAEPTEPADIFVMQYNMGSGPGDMVLKWGHLGKEMRELSTQEDRERKYTKIAALRNQYILKEVEKVDIFFFQEVLKIESNQDLMQGLKDYGFTVCGTSDRSACRIAVKTDQFKEIGDQSFITSDGGEDVACVQAVHKTGRVVNLVSAQFSGFSFQEPGEGVVFGDKSCKEIVDSLNKLDTITIIGCDLNSQRNIHAGRHKIFDDGRYTDYTSAGHTAENEKEELKHRNLDYFFVRNLPKNAEFKIVDQSGDEWENFLENQNNSDHLPIFGRLVIG